MTKKRQVAHCTSRKSNREFYMPSFDSRINDAELHEPILNNPAAESVVREIGKAAARRAGLSDEEIEKLYG